MPSFGQYEAGEPILTVGSLFSPSNKTVHLKSASLYRFVTNFGLRSSRLQFIRCISTYDAWHTLFWIFMAGASLTPRFRLVCFPRGWSRYLRTHKIIHSTHYTSDETAILPPLEADFCDWLLTCEARSLPLPEGRNNYSTAGKMWPLYLQWLWKVLLLQWD